MLRSFPTQVATHVDRHAVKPRGKGPGLVEPTDVFVKPKENFLTRITRILEIPQQSPGGAEDLCFEPGYECVEGISVA
jgi:hypothetical protein